MLGPPPATDPTMRPTRLILLLTLVGTGFSTSIAAEPARHARAHWLDPETVVWPGAPSNAELRLVDRDVGTGALADVQAVASIGLPLQALPGGLSGRLAQRFPHLSGKPAWRLEGLSDDATRTWLTGPLGVVALSVDGAPIAATGLQVAGVLDALFVGEGNMGVHFTGDQPVFRLWAPTAREVVLLLFDDAAPDTEPQRYPMVADRQAGAWTLHGEPGWNRRYYQYEVTAYRPDTGQVQVHTVTDPWSVSLSAHSRRSQVVDLADPDLAPAGWSSLTKPDFTAPEDIVIYELHLRDFSIRDSSVPDAERGTYRAFTRSESDGMRHLARLADAGISHLHLLPVFDIATVPERRADHWSIDRDALSRMPPDSVEQQAAVTAIKVRDGFNWGYDPWHYSVPEGSYATDPVGVPRILEFREMVMALSRAGLRVVMDVVYNHTHASGPVRGSVLDQVVPGYYQRLDDNGAVATSTCCANTASEHRMMEKLMVDSVLVWARHYKVDGFRFDLMGHHSLENLRRVREALDGLTLDKDGVDGRSIYLYGEGWNFGEVANDLRFKQARQGNLAGTGIGSFSDRMRDGARGGFYNSHPATQGFINGLGTDPSAHSLEQGPGLASLLQSTDWIRIGLVADLADYTLHAADGAVRRADAIDYNGAPAGYTADPGENIAYVAAHDNETLFDANQLKLPRSVPMADRVRVQTLGSALVLLGQGVPFVHAGQEILRSKSLDRNSYDAGDWFNAMDWRLEDGNWGRGLPLAQDNESHWPVMAPLLADPALAPSAADRRQALDDFEALLRIRGSSRLFRLRNASAIHASVRFHNTGPEQLPGVIAMSITDAQGDLNDTWRQVVVVFNARPDSITLDAGDWAWPELRPHPLQIERMQGQFSETRLQIPARSVMVWVAP